MVVADEETLNPLVLSAFGFEGSAGMGSLDRRKTADFEFEFLTAGGGTQDIGGVSYPLVAGDLVWRRPGVATQGHPPYSCLTVVLELSGVRRPGREPYRMGRPLLPQPDLRVAALEGLPPVFTPGDPDEFRRVFGALVRTFANPGPGALLRLRALALTLLVMLGDEVRGPGRELVTGPSLRFRGVLRYLEAHYHRPLALADLAREAGLSPTWFHARFTEALGVTPREYLTRVRLSRARELLVATRLPAAEVGRSCGFANPAYFYTLFRRQTGQTPGEFRQRHSPLDN